jgi:hypothetical protein
MFSPNRLHTTSPERVHSDSNINWRRISTGDLSKAYDNNRKSPTPMAPVVDFDLERGVHGGEYSVRPDQQESMVFLRKFFMNQQQQEHKGYPPNASTYSGFLTPPENPVRKFTVVFNCYESMTSY